MTGQFDGVTFDAARDGTRLNLQHERIFNLVSDGAWWTLAELSAKTGDPEASISARLRDFRKPKFGGFQVKREYIGEGMWQYRLTMKG